MSPKSWEAHAARIAREQLLKEAEETMEIIGDAGTELAAVKTHHAALEYKAYQEGLFISLDEPDMEPEELRVLPGRFLRGSAYAHRSPERNIKIAWVD